MSIDICNRTDSYELVAGGDGTIKSEVQVQAWVKAHPHPTREYIYSGYSRLYNIHDWHYRIYLPTDAERVINSTDKLYRAKVQLEAGERRQSLLDAYRETWEVINATTSCQATHCKLYPHPESFVEAVIA